MLLFNEKLTKKFFMQLPEGLYLVSNVHQGTTYDHRPAFEGVVGPLSKREQQWREIKEVSADRRLCEVFESREKYLASCRKFKGIRG